MPYLGLVDGSPPGAPGGGITGIREPEAGGVRFIPGSTPAGGVMTPPERPRSELLVPVSGGTIGVLGWSAFGRSLRSSAETATARKDKSTAATLDTLCIPTPRFGSHVRQTVRWRLRP
jgi:hypothetical protein